MALTHTLAHCYRHMTKQPAMACCKMAKTPKYVKSTMAVELAAIAK